MIWRHLQVLALGIVAGVLLSGCGGGGSEPTPPGPDPQPVGLLRKVNNAAELEASIKRGLTQIRSGQSFDATVGSLGGAAPSSSQYSRTYTQEANVDEFDSVKYDGQYLFIAPKRQQFPCCFLAAQWAGDVGPPLAERSIRILETDPAAAGATEVATIPLADEISVQGLYRSANRLVALTTRHYYGSYGDPWANLSIWAPEYPNQTGLSAYDTSDISQPVLIFNAAIDGVFVESRRVDDTVYVVSRYTPDIDGLVYEVRNAADQAANLAILNNVTLAQLLPHISVNGNDSTLVTPANCYVPRDELPAYPVITSITAIPVTNPDAFVTTCYADDAYGTYVAESAMYLVQSRQSGEGTRLHKFALNPGAPTYVGSGDIDGIVWQGGQKDFRLSEKDGYLRVFASKNDWVAPDFIDHFLYVLRESATAPVLEVVSRLPNAAHPEEIGKPNEQLYGVRFVNDRAYAVTYERIDPLYVFDLSNPADPRVVGTLEISGFSDFLHPVTDDLLLGLGTSDNNAIKLELFDVSNITQPLSVGSDILGGRGSYSEAVNDRHAFTYLADINGVDRFAIPADLTADDDSYARTESGLFLYEIHDKTTPNLASLMRVGSVIVHDNGQGMPFYYSSRSRAVLHDDTIYYVRDDEVFSTLWGNPQYINGPL